jgi:hypothetical protein
MLKQKPLSNGVAHNWRSQPDAVTRLFKLSSCEFENMYGADARLITPTSVYGM